MCFSVTGEVHIKKGPQNRRVRAGDSVKFMCTATTDTLRYGLARIEWRRDDEKIQYKKDPRIFTNPLDKSLTINNATHSDTGLYTCIASLGTDIDSASAQLIVEGE